MTVSRTSLETLFQPRSIAIIGASNEPDRIGGRPLHLLKRSFKGDIYPVNPNRGEVQGIRAYASIEGVPGEVDLAIVAVPARFVPETVAACGRKGVHTAIVLSSGFAEEGPQGAEQQKGLVEIARRHGMRLLGPNCMGVGNRGLGMWCTFSASASDALAVGGISIVAQSGAFGSYVLSLMRRRGLGVNLWATTGNQSDVDISDCIAYFAQDPATKVIFGYFEGVSDGERLVQALELARRNRKPVIVTKVGRSEAGANAAASHTASLAGSDAIYDAVFRQYGVYRAETIEEALDIAYVCAQTAGGADGDRVGLVSVSGGVGIMMTDAAVQYGLDPHAVPAATQEKLREILPRSSVNNPIDLTAQVQNDFTIVERCLELLFAEADYDCVAVFLASLDLFPPLHEASVEVFRRFRARNPDRIIALITNAEPEGRRRYEACGYLLFEEPARAIRALAALRGFRTAFAQPPREPLARGVESAILRKANGALDEQQAKAVLREAGIAVPNERLVGSAGAAVSAARAIGYPVALKIVSADIVHKSDIGGVALNLSGDAQVEAAWERIMTSVSEQAPQARIEGLLVSPMISGGTEIVLGVQNDAVFGPVVMAGLGGIFVEVFKDVSFRRAPVMAHEARQMLDELRGRALLRGVRGRPPADVEALVKAIVDLSRFSAGNAALLDSIDVNPILALPAGDGVVAVDAVVQLKPAAAREALGA